MKSPFSKTVGYELLHAARLHRARTAQLLSEIGLFPGQEQVLTLLALEDGRTMSDLAAHLRVRPPTASKTVARLAAQGLVERRASDGDARVVRVGLTEEGWKRVAAVDAVWETLEAEMVGDLDAKERRRLRKLLRKAGRNVSPKGAPAAVADDETAEESLEG